MGSFNDYRIEEFTKLDHDTEETVNFQVRGVPCMNFSGKVTPLNYKRSILKRGRSYTIWQISNALLVI